MKNSYLLFLLIFVITAGCKKSSDSTNPAFQGNPCKVLSTIDTVDRQGSSTSFHYDPSGNLLYYISTGMNGAAVLIMFILSLTRSFTPIRGIMFPGTLTSRIQVLAHGTLLM